jgi:signal transduction histidine kinase
LPNIGQVFADSVRLQQIIWNLLSNAIKFTPNEGRVSIRLERINQHAQITVTDTGKGINPDFLPHIFEYFRQEDTSLARQYGGLGLGLAIVRSLVEAHGGTIFATSPGVGKGATFTVTLPLLDVEF